MAVGATVITHLSGFEKMATGIHLITLLERIRNCRCYWQLNCFELLRMYLSCTHTPLDSAPSKPLRPLVHLAARFAFTRTAFAAFTFFVSHDFLLCVWWLYDPIVFWIQPTSITVFRCGILGGSWASLS